MRHLCPLGQLGRCAVRSIVIAGSFVALIALQGCHKGKETAPAPTKSSHPPGTLGNDDADKPGTGVPQCIAGCQARAGELYRACMAPVQHNKLECDDIYETAFNECANECT